MKRRCEQCGQAYGTQAHHGRRFCSLACHRASVAAQPRQAPNPEAVLAEITAAYADFREVDR